MAKTSYLLALVLVGVFAYTGQVFAGTFVNQNLVSGPEIILEKGSSPGGNYVYPDAFPYAASVGVNATTTLNIRDNEPNVDTSPTNAVADFQCWNGSSWVTFLTTSREDVVGVGGILSDGDFHLVELYGVVDSDYSSCQPELDNDIRVQFGVGGIGPPNQGRSKSFSGYPYLVSEADGAIAVGSDLTTRIISITQPELYETVASTTIDIAFEYYNSDTLPANVYALEFTHTLTGAYVYVPYEWLDADSVNNAFTQTATVTLPRGGTWKMTAFIADGSGDLPNAPAFVIDVSDSQWFHAEFSDNSTVVVFDPAQFMGFASTSCMINWSLDFSVSDCAGYLFYPANLANNYQTLPQQASSRIPFSYISQVSNTWMSLSNTGGTVDSINFDFADLPIASSSPLSAAAIIGNVEVFSEDTVTDFMPDGWLDIMRTLAGAAIIMSGFAMMFFTARNTMKT